MTLGRAGSKLDLPPERLENELACRTVPSRQVPGFNADGEVTAVTDPDTNTTTSGYDQAGNQIVSADPLGRVTVTTFDGDNRVASVTDRLGRKRLDAYDPDGRLLSETWKNADGSTADTRSYTYDQAGNVLTAGNGFGSYVYTYDNAGRRQTQTDPFGKLLTYGYDPNGNVTSVQDSLGGQLASVYDPDNRLTSRQFGGTGQTPLRLDLTYTPRGQPATQTRYNGLQGTTRPSARRSCWPNIGAGPTRTPACRCSARPQTMTAGPTAGYGSAMCRPTSRATWWPTSSRRCWHTTIPPLSKLSVTPRCSLRTRPRSACAGSRTAGYRCAAWETGRWPGEFKTTAWTSWWTWRDTPARGWASSLCGRPRCR
jgi:YD repeat-containing protein